MLHEIFIVLTAIAAVGLLVGGIDDVFIDAYYWLRELYRKLFLRGTIRAIPQQDLCAPAEKSIAIWIPAWHEHEVIDKMLLHSIDAIKYENYAIFVGTYPNDGATQAAVDSVSARYPNVKRIVCTKPGPTNKADCLNAVYQGMVRAEQENGTPYEIVALHDAEDIIHPLELKLFNWLIPRKDMVQIPTIPLERPLKYWTAGTYLDEFAEDHLKELLVRERLARVIPSAGVGTAVSRSVLQDLAASRGNELFNINSLTEDYEFGFGLASLKRSAILAQFSVALTQPVFRGGRRERQEVRAVRKRIAVRAFFPDEFRQAVGQKARWALGISLQGWKNLGWPGGFWMKYMLYRDRKALYTQPVYVIGYLVFLYWLLNFAIYGWELMPGLASSEWVRTIIIADAFFLGHRLIQRVIAVWRISDWRQAVVSIPRSVVGNVINVCATAKAIHQFVTSERSGKPVAWHKTIHVFPTTQQLQEYNRRLGDLLLENRLVTICELRHALKIQARKGQKLGQVLTQMGYVSEEDLLKVLGRHLNIPFGSLVQGSVDPALLEKLPRETAEALMVLPLRSLNGFVEVACADPTMPQVTHTLEALLGCPVSLRLATETDLRFAITRAYLAKDGGASRLLGELLVQAGTITHADLHRALKFQQKWGSRLGETLQDMGLISAEMLIAALKDQEQIAAD